MAKVKEYKIISYYHYNLADLEKDVNLALKDGWSLWEPIQTVLTSIPKNKKEFSSLAIYTQVMVRYEDED